MNITKILREIGEAKKDVIGQDVSLKTCINEGYLMINQANEPVTLDRQYRFFSFTPDYIIEENPHLLNKPELMTDETLNIGELLGIYSLHKKGIDGCCDCNHSLNAEDYTNVYQILSLAGDIDPYCGLR